MALFVTAFDEGFWIKGLTSLRSFEKFHASKDKTIVVPLDNQTFEFFNSNFKNLSTYLPQEEALPSRIRDLKRFRNFVEYACTIKPFVLEHAMKLAEKDEWVFWFDADSEFFSDTSKIYREAIESVFLSSHRYSVAFQQFEAGAGKFNGGLIGFRNNLQGHAALKWWADRCEEDCPYEPTEDKYLDQKYLNRLPELFQVHVSRTPGINEAPWNIDNAVEIKEIAGRFTSAGHDLVYFHFQGLKIVNRWVLDRFAGDWSVPKAADKIYARHAKSLKESIHTLDAISAMSARNFQKTSYKGLVKRALGWKKGLRNLSLIS